MDQINIQMVNSGVIHDPCRLLGSPATNYSSASDPEGLLPVTSCIDTMTQYIVINSSLGQINLNRKSSHTKSNS